MSHDLSVRSLRDVTLEQLHRTSSEAFSDYPVDAQVTPEQLSSMHRQNDVRLELSAGLFRQDRLVGFWVNGVRTIEGRKVAYDSGTAICKAYRGQGGSTRLSELSSALLAGHGVREYVLEVLTQNERAYRIYLKDGFRVRRKLLCLKAAASDTFSVSPPDGLRLDEGPLDPGIIEDLPAMDFTPSWQNATRSMVNDAGAVHAVLIRRAERIVGYGMVLSARGRITQLGFEESHWDSDVPSLVLERLRRASRTRGIAAINVDPGAERTLRVLSRHGFRPWVEQYEMTRPIDAAGS